MEARNATANVGLRYIGFKLSPNLEYALWSQIRYVVHSVKVKVSRDIYGPDQYSALRSRTHFELALIENVFGVREYDRLNGERDTIVLPPDGGIPKRSIFGVANLVVGEWRAPFRQECPALIVLAEFKLLDMLWEWVLFANGITETHRFEQKLVALRGPLELPPILAARLWLSCI